MKANFTSSPPLRLWPFDYLLFTSILNALTLKTQLDSSFRTLITGIFSRSYLVSQSIGPTFQVKPTAIILLR